MIDWTTRAKENLSDTEWGSTDITDESGDTSVLSVRVADILENHTLNEALLDAAMRRCDQFGDSEKARNDMRHECLTLPPDQQVFWLSYFLGQLW